MIRRVGVSGLALLLGSSALALGVLTIAGPALDSDGLSSREWTSQDAAITPVVFEQPKTRLPAVAVREAVFLARPAAVMISPPTAAATDFEDSDIRPVALEVKVAALPEIPVAGSEALASVSGVRLQPPDVASMDSDLGGSFEAVALDVPAPTLPEISTTGPGELASVSGVRIQPPDFEPLSLGMEEGFVAVELRPVEVGLPELAAPAPTGLLCMGDCGPGPMQETCDVTRGAT